MQDVEDEDVELHEQPQIPADVVNNGQDVVSEVLKMSKNQLKRQRKTELWESRKKVIKDLKKEKKKEMKTHQHHPESHQIFDRKERSSEQKTRRERLREEMTVATNSRFSVIVDMSFEDSHNSKTLKSLCQQVSFCYGFNRKHPLPVHLYLTGVGPKSREQLSKTKFQNWLCTTVTDSCCSALDEFVSVYQSGDGDSTNKRRLVYLTSDAEETLERLDDSEAYIIGGIVDRNSLKGMTLKKAVAQGIRTAKLPIREYLKLSGSHVLTVNHVFEILLTFAELQCWKATLERVLPLRKANDKNKSKDKDGLCVQRSGVDYSTRESDHLDKSDVDGEGDEVGGDEEALAEKGGPGKGGARHHS